MNHYSPGEKTIFLIPWRNKTSLNNFRNRRKKNTFVLFYFSKPKGQVKFKHMETGIL